MRRRIAEEASLAAGIIAGGLYLFARFSFSVWGQLFLFNGDSLLLPLVDRSITRHEHFHWVFSAPLFFFPEGPIYFIIDALTPSVQWALILNGIVNLLIIYALLRLLAGRVFASRSLGTIAALSVTVVLMFFVVTERDRQPQGAYASLLLFNTYYVGVVFIGLLVLYLITRLSDANPREFKVVLSSIFVLITAGTASDPLLIIQVVLPLMASLAVMRIARMIVPRTAAWLVLAGILGVAFATLLRATLLRNLIVADVDGYLKSFDLGKSWASLHAVLSVSWADSLQRFELAVIILAIAGSFILAVHTIIVGRGCLEVMPTNLIICFGSLSSPAIIGSVLVSDNVLTRYMIPLVIFPFLACFPLLRNIPIGTPRRAVVVTVSGLLFLLAILGVRNIAAVRTFATQRAPGAQCLDDAALSRDARYGVAFFWRARALDLYSDRERVLQVKQDFTAFLWLTNIGAYAGKDFTFVLVDTPPPSPDSALNAADTVRQLGPPRSITSCGSFDVYFYGSDTDGHTILNARIADSIR
jgi:hypothetical protein